MENLLIIRDLAKSRKLTIRELAKRVHITESGLQKIIKDGKTKTSTLEAIGRELGVTLHYLMTGNEGNVIQDPVIEYGTSQDVKELRDELNKCQEEVELLKMQRDVFARELLSYKTNK
jgi:transcriptional regulator with XRE-family HTH domain